MERKTKSPVKYADDPLFLEVIREAPGIQDRFATLQIQDVVFDPISIRPSLWRHFIGLVCRLLWHGG